VSAKLQLTAQDIIESCEVHGFPLDPDQLDVVAAVVNQVLLSASKPAAPDGWKLVPVEPVSGMAGAGGLLPRGERLFSSPSNDADRVEVIGFAKACEVWRAMLAASPAAPAQSVELVGIAMTDEDVFALQDTLKTLELIAKGETYSKDHDLDGAMQKATIRHAMQHASYVLKRFKPAYFRLTDAFHGRSRAPQPSPTAVVQDDERAAFDEWCNSIPANRSMGPWEIWQAARAASPQPVAQPVEQTARTYTTKAGEAVAGIALRQCGNEKEWRHILACNPQFADLLPSDYFPVGTVLTLPPVAAVERLLKN